MNTRDLRVLTVVQSWRIIGGAFIVLYFYDLLPGLFAWPAGLGDIAIGGAAPFVALALAARPEFMKSRGFKAFHILGILDFVVAVGTGFLSSGWVESLASEVSTNQTMTLLPLSLIPTFGVPLWIMLHLSALFQAKERN